MSNNTKVSIIIPCRNEEKYIGRCFDSIISQDYPKENLEILVIDGMSEDRTREVILEFSKRCPNIRLLENQKKITPTALNIGIRESRGEYILRADAHSIYENDYIKKCVEYLEKTGADCVGGALNTKSGSDSFVAEAISFVLSSVFGVGSSFRTIKKEAYVDTVPFGAYRREIFDKIGFFNEKLVRNQDIELNSRIRKAGGKIFLTPEIKLIYFAPSTFKKLILQQFQNGLWNVYTQKLAPRSLSLRHFIPLFLVVGLIGGFALSPFSPFGKVLFALIFGSYLLLDLFFSINISLKKGLKYLIILLPTFFTLHFVYGLGSIWGLLTFWKIKK